MKSLDYSIVIGEDLAELHSLYRKQSRSLARRRLRFLILLKTGKCHSQAEAGNQIGIGPRASEKLWSLYRHQGMASLLEKPHSGHPAKLNKAAKEGLQEQLEGNQLQTLGQACDFVLDHYGITISKVAMHYYFHTLGIKKKTGRPSNVRKDAAGEEAFKKKSFPN